MNCENCKLCEQGWECLNDEKIEKLLWCLSEWLSSFKLNNIMVYSRNEIWGCPITFNLLPGKNKYTKIKNLLNYLKDTKTDALLLGPNMEEFHL